MNHDTGDRFRIETLSRRTASLAARGLDRDAAADSPLLPPLMVCETHGRLHGLPPALVEAALPAVWHPIPMIAASAMPAMLGIVGRGGQLYSLLDLACLFGDGVGQDRPVATGTMLLLHRRDRWPGGTAGRRSGHDGPDRLVDHRVAVRVDRVLGLLTLRMAGDGHGLLAAVYRDIVPIADARLVSLIDADALGHAIAVLDRPADRLPDSIGA